MSVIRGELFFFKSRYVWRIRDGRLQPGYPALASRHWRGIPDNIDATFEDKTGNIWFFQGGLTKAWPKLDTLQGKRRNSWTEFMLYCGHKSTLRLHIVCCSGIYGIFHQRNLSPHCLSSDKQDEATV